jgi:hypothetical protein
MDWLTNGSKTLVTCVAIAGIVVLACFGKISGADAMGLVGTLVLGYGTVNMIQNRNNPPAPPAEQEKTP